MRDVWARRRPAAGAGRAVRAAAGRGALGETSRAAPRLLLVPREHRAAWHRSPSSAELSSVSVRAVFPPRFQRPEPRVPGTAPAPRRPDGSISQRQRLGDRRRAAESRAG